ncbi:MAG: outer membrane beta-barrel protein [Deltaproteobacteria bacterium]|nr:outer membrane beta-barrel protein [Deltaproteobacteria bacterium]
MRSGWMIFTAALVFAAAPQLAGADDADVQEQLRLMQERMMLLEDKLENTNDQLEAATEEVQEQKQVLSNAGIKFDERGASGVDSFLQSLEIGGWINISYWHNFNGPTNGECPDQFNASIAETDDDDQNNSYFPFDCANLLPASLNANTGNGATALGSTAGLGSNLVPGGFFNPTNPDSQGFSFDQAWFELGRPTSPENRSGFRFDVTMGKIADILDARSSNNSRDSRSDNDIYIHQANIQYLADVPKVGDVNFTVGKFSTLVGYEAPQATYNHNISRGILWGFFQPVDHLGLLASGTIDRRFHFLGSEGRLDWDMGFVNGFDADDSDLNHAKTFTARARMTGENWSIQVAGLTGKEDGAPNRVDCDEDPFEDNSEFCNLVEDVFDERGSVGDNQFAQTNTGFGGSESENVTLLDVIMTWDPFTDLSLWMNVNRMWVNSDGADPDAWGMSVGGHYTINERLGFTLRTEFMQWEDPGGTLLGFTNVRLPYGSSGFYATDGCENGENGRAGQCQYGSDADVFSITGTVGYQLTDRIKIRGELRYDNFELFGRRGNAGLLASDQIFNEGTADSIDFDDDDDNCDVCGGDSDQFLAGVDVIYEF